MKKIIATLLTLATAWNFAEESPVITQPPLVNQLLVQPKPYLEEAPAKKNWFLYVKMAMADNYPVNFAHFVPGFGFGYRFSRGHHGIDICSNGAHGRGWKGTTKTAFWTFPRASYLYYFNPVSNQSFYVGGGLGWGSMDTKRDSEFLGIIPNAIFGLEMCRNASFHTFVECTISQAAVPRSTSGPFPGPIGEMAVGAGF